jgi:hypothetical protein
MLDMYTDNLPTITLKELEDNFDFVFTLIERENVTFKVKSDDQTVLFMPIKDYEMLLDIVNTTKYNEGLTTV